MQEGSQTVAKMQHVVNLESNGRGSEYATRGIFALIQLRSTRLGATPMTSFSGDGQCVSSTTVTATSGGEAGTRAPLFQSHRRTSSRVDIHHVTRRDFSTRTIVIVSPIGWRHCSYRGVPFHSIPCTTTTTTKMPPKLHANLPAERAETPRL